ncbi:hypothetical protein SAMN05660226_01041 [Parapedobacter luteus]|uniref:Uncharacterized protein n=1 Tax=Parapedobacter luteus TaxID=623280 RepID=A0A1T5AT90_9SPHI|nr:hypothetical protein [Parapedobacter luteus]SKB38135.1 hypothetical protein SAMN05660226_01041 [Parapedobacter luteus]
MIIITKRFVLRNTCTAFLCCLALVAAAQAGSMWPGIWEMKYQPWPHIPAIRMQLHISAPVKNMLYPAKLSLTYGGFAGEYELLLVKKHDRRLGIGRNKVPVDEQPFGLGPWMMYLNGTLDHERGDTADQLRLSRLWIDDFGVFMSGLYDDELQTNTKVYIRDFLYRGAIVLQRADTTPWVHPHTSRIVHTDSLYYGVYDPIPTDAPTLSFAVQDEERYDHDTVTVVHNGRLIAHNLPVEKAMELDELTLDTGENYIAFFADNYGALPPNTANFLIGTGGSDAGLFAFDFSNRANAYATVMVARFQYRPGSAAVRPHPEPTVPAYRGKTAGRRNMLIGQWTVRTEKIELEIWDQQVEDGDIISIQVNGATVADGLAVTKAGKRFGVMLKPGNNRILFRAENLGRIPPNTAALRITAGGQTKTFQLSTDAERNNVLDIILEK